jgi:hypothetical protein
VSWLDASYYLMANRRPFSRFVPVFYAAATKSDASEVRRDLLAPDVRYVLLDRNKSPFIVANNDPGDLPSILFSDVAKNFVRIGTIGFFEVWLRDSPQ